MPVALQLAELWLGRYQEAPPARQSTRFHHLLREQTAPRPSLPFDLVDVDYCTFALSSSSSGSSSNIQARRRRLLLPWSANIIVPTSRAAYDLDLNVSAINRHDYHMSAKTCILSQLPMSFGAPQEYFIQTSRTTTIQDW